VPLKTSSLFLKEIMSRKSSGVPGMQYRQLHSDRILSMISRNAGNWTLVTSIMSSGFSNTAPQHTAHDPTDCLTAMPPGCIILSSADITWPARSPDLFEPDYFSLGTFEIQSTYKQMPHTSKVEGAHQGGNKSLAKVCCKQLLKIFTKLTTRLQTCLEMFLFGITISTFSERINVACMFNDTVFSTAPQGCNTVYDSGSV
jgi:hypothetical protein